MLILGGGPAGTAWIALANAGREVTVLERLPTIARREPAAGSTVTALRARGLGPLHGVRPPALARNHGGLGSAELTHNDFIANPLGPGWHADRRQFDEMLARAAKASARKILRAARLLRWPRCLGDLARRRDRSDSTIER